ncbi:MAG: T9SS C-terminal target domain-containing protein [Bacteroidetes bacterium]|nr:MAG: T9SS C-terminal target domain-containing protein [Bacteroidota bacterium]
MKKLITSIITVLLVQTGFGQSTLPNGDFEEWTYNSTHGFWEPDGGFFKTLNILDTIPTPPGVTVYRTDSAYSGTYAARLITRKIDLLDVLIPGVIGTIKINWLTLNATLGLPYIWATKASRFQGYYMAFPLNGDSTGAVLLLSKWNNTSNKRDTIAYNKLTFQGVVNTYTKFDEEIDYWNTTTMPDTITLLLLSCGGYNAANMMGSVGQVGSQAYFDAVTLTDISGFEYMLMPEVDVRLAPNPATDRMVVTLSKLVKNGQFVIFNPQGKRIRTLILNEKRGFLNVSDLANGLYYYKLTDGSRPLNSGSFIVTK